MEAKNLWRSAWHLIRSDLRRGPLPPMPLYGRSHETLLGHRIPQPLMDAALRVHRLRHLYASLSAKLAGKA